MSCAGEVTFGRQSLFTRAQHLEALAWFREQNGRRGANSELARKYGISPTGMRHLLKRAEYFERESA